MKILLIGGTGFIGRAVTQHLLAAGHEPLVLHRGRTQALSSIVRALTIDRDDLIRHRTDLRKLGPDVVIDAYAQTERHARDTLAVFAGHAGRLVLISSADVYRNYDGLRGRSHHVPDPPPLAENAQLRERHYPYRGQPNIRLPYRDDYDKVLVERIAARAANLSVTVLRLPLVYGPGDHQRRLWPYLQRIRDGRPCIMLGNQQARWRWTHGYIENVAAAVTLAATDARAAGQIYNLGETQTPTEGERINALGIAAGWKGELYAVPEEILPVGLRLPLNFNYSLSIDTKRLRAELGFCDPINEATAVQHTVDWELANPVPGPSPDYSTEDAVMLPVGCKISGAAAPR